MIPIYDIEYRLARKRVELQASLDGKSVEARDAHAVLADLYANRAGGGHEARGEGDFKC